MLTIADFQKTEAGVGFPPYFQYITKDQREVCLEPCLQGFCIGIYDDEQNLIGEKRCTNYANDMEMTWEGVPKFGDEVNESALAQAVIIANTMLAVCDECNGRGEFINDSYDHRGEHTQRVDKCLTCDGTGRYNGENEE